MTKMQANLPDSEVFGMGRRDRFIELNYTQCTTLLLLVRYTVDLQILKNSKTLFKKLVLTYYC